MAETPSMELPGLTRSEIEKFRKEGFPEGHLFDDPAKFTTREEVVGRQAVVAMKCQLLLQNVGGTFIYDVDKKIGAWYVTLYEGLIERDAQLAQQGLGCDTEKVRLLGRV